MTFSKPHYKTQDKSLQAILVGVYQDDKASCEEELVELQALSTTCGIDSLTHVTCHVVQKQPSTLIHRGKIEELLTLARTLQADIVIFDEAITAAQQRNLEKIFKIPVIDRTEVILEIFAARAHTKAAKIQIELASIEYFAPRLKRLWGHLSRQRAKGGYLRGEGETQLELDKRVIKRKKQQLKKALEQVQKTRLLQRAQRTESLIPSCALIGYTNAGKSSLFQALTKANVLIEDKLFATLDPITRKLRLPNHQDITLTDTVGFIQKLPHLLIEAFKSTLESALYDDVLLHVIDVSHPAAQLHAETTLKLLQELQIPQPRLITVLNKIDRCQDQKMIYKLKLKYPPAVAVSAVTQEGFDLLLEAIQRSFAHYMHTDIYYIPQTHYPLCVQIQQQGTIEWAEYGDEIIELKATVPHSLAKTLSPFIKKNITL